MSTTPDLLERTQWDLVLASNSPRRRELLALFNIPFRVLVGEPDAEESVAPAPPAIQSSLPLLDLPMLDHPVLRAWRKLDATCALVPGAIVIAADTIVVLNHQVLNKPIDTHDAQRMLRLLSGRVHTVYTGIVVADTRRYRAGGVSIDGLVLQLISSDVVIAELDDDTIAAYVATGEPLDKAGAYGIQGLGGDLVKAVIGSYTGVVGLPLVALHDLLNTVGVPIAEDPARCYHRWLHAQGKEPLPCPPTYP